MPSRPLSPNFNHPTTTQRTRILFLTLLISASLVILFTILYFLYHLWHSLLNRSRTLPFDSTTHFKLQRFSYKELKVATNEFSDGNILGKGGSGTVFRGIGRDGKLYAIKRLDTLSLQSEREFQNELQILGGLRSPFLVTLLGYCVDKDNRLLVYEYMPNKSLQELLFGEGNLGLSWDTRFSIILDVSKALEYLHFGCEPPVIHGDIKPSNVLLDFDLRAKVSDFGLSRIKVDDGEFGFSQDLWKSQELSGNLTPESTPPVDSCNEVDFALALQASSSSKNTSTTTCYNNVKALNFNSLNYNSTIASESDVKLGNGNGNGNGKGKELSCSGLDVNADEWNSRFVPYELDEQPSSIDHSKELNFSTSSAVVVAVDDSNTSTNKQWGKDWWWRQDGNGELRSKDYVMEWIGSQICPSTNPDWDEEKKSSPKGEELNSSAPLDRSEDACESRFEVEETGSRGRKNNRRIIRKNRKMQEWWKEEHLDEISNKKNNKLKKLETKWKNNFKAPRFHLSRRFHFHRRKKASEQNQIESEQNGGEFSFRRGGRKKKVRCSGSDMSSTGDLFSRELSSTTSMRGTLCYVAPEYGGCGYLMEKADIYSLGVLILVIVSGRRPLHVLASPMKLEKANLISWCRHLAQAGNILELVDERLKDDYNKEQASLCINLALNCLQKMPELRPDIVDIIKILKGDMDFPSLPFEFSPSPLSKLFSRSRRRHKSNAE